MYTATINNGKSGEDENRIYMKFEEETLDDVVKACEVCLRTMDIDGEPYIFIKRIN